MKRCANCQFFEPDWEEPWDGYCHNPESERFKDYALLNEACDFFQALETIEVLEIA
ncbi:hypothetical protein LEP1GSC036_3910 [Leptospira weilii str. 2006001853]|uniref:Uncharacterized protein n=1 Tax=Leptospira weilii str. 2006001853 TaxID=1001589 RepID=A0A828Z8U8_9LEPT|nr:hypothetical protein [Leptospira weilii]EKR66280.1 hypothetical protein LEP1GSC036_3910 [Leptospira weilii str. 2006001853]EMN43365.1 hypothetical protein LEP1GSC086_1036 [Leptospira weilii str. LNT 1234]